MGGGCHTIPMNGANLGADSESAIVEAGAECWCAGGVVLLRWEADALEGRRCYTASQPEVEAIREWR